MGWTLLATWPLWTNCIPEESCEEKEWAVFILSPQVSIYVIGWKRPALFFFLMALKFIALISVLGNCRHKARRLLLPSLCFVFSLWYYCYFCPVFIVVAARVTIPCFHGAWISFFFLPLFVLLFFCSGELLTRQSNLLPGDWCSVHILLSVVVIGVVLAALFLFCYLCCCCCCFSGNNLKISGRLHS